MTQVVGVVLSEYYSTTQLKPCPFCGCETIHLDSGNLVTVGMNSYFGEYAECDNCAASSPICDGKEQVMKAWNKRA